ncbi:MarR family winged helix-turn-helix transcriptional regulator [Streptomyces sp. NBC_01353]|uniref:MarR family winged helix-turn-helix transcriptional regulator n=1 Tax=Streptomyces sp. NBC_01353 TaxID=2903835 RepID=UPI002E35F696|nr:MarR family winged helix-turn-helix transcriptional regulator [Streptomyces sp. NBC_01353]
MPESPSAPPSDPVCSGPLPTAAQGGPVSHALARVARLHRIAAGRLLKEVGLYPGQEFLMMCLWDCGPVRQSELIKAMGVDASTVTKMLQRLEQSGHVRRSPDPTDRRAVLVAAADEGGTLRSGVADVWTGLEEYALAGLTPAERADLARLLSKVEGNLCAEAGGAELGDCSEPKAGRRA